MVLVTALHVIESDRGLGLHFHNVIFGIRREVKAGACLVAPLDYGPMLERLAPVLELKLVAALASH